MTKRKPEKAELGTGSVLDYLRTASPSLLQQFELAHLNHAAMLRKQLIEILDQLVEDAAEASLARLLIEHRKNLLPTRPHRKPDRIAQIVEELPCLDLRDNGKKEST